MLLVVSFTAAGSLHFQSENIHQLTAVDDPAVEANNDIRQAMSDAQTGLMGYEISGDRTLLQPYFGSRDRTMTALATLEGKLALGAPGEADTARREALGGTQRLAVEQWSAHALRTEQILSSGGQPDDIQGRALFGRFSRANAALDAYLTAERERTRLESRTISLGVAISLAGAVAALVAMLVLGGRVARTISNPLTELRDTMVRQRQGEPGARAREEQGSSELRSVARDFNALTDQNVLLLKTHERALGGHKVTSEIGRAIRSALDTQAALDIACAGLAEGLGVDRVIGQTFGIDHKVLLGAQWHHPDLYPIGDLSTLPELGDVAAELWASNDCWAGDDLLAQVEQSPAPISTFCSVAGARALIMVPIGFHDRVIGMMCVLMVRGPREWVTSETNVVQAVAGFVARAIVEAENQAHQREYVQRVEMLDRQKSDFLATVSHELRTPLTSISGYLELLQDGDVGELTQQQYGMLDVINRSTARLRSLIEDVIMLNRIEGGVSRANFTEVSVRELLIRVGEEVTVLAQNNDVELEIDAGPQEAVVLGDRASLDRAVVNIFSNAIKFSHPRSVVTIRGVLDHEARRILITCQDRGVGIPAHDLGNLFTRFFRASNATDQSIPGTGLGLSIAKQIVEDHHGGELRLISVENEGTTVIMDLPLYELAETETGLGMDPSRNAFSAYVPDLAD
jgi:signal transduction histidine kinase